VKEVFNDFSKEYKDASRNPLLYEVYVCPECGYAFTDQFDETKHEDQRKQFIKNVSSNWRKQNFSEERSYEEAIRVFKLAVLTARETSQPDIVVAGLCMKLSWLLRYIDDLNEEKRFVTFAIGKFEKAYISGYFGSMAEIKVMYILGELNRQAGSNDKAIKYFSKVIQHKSRNSEKQIVEMARDQWYKSREVSSS